MILFSFDYPPVDGGISRLCDEIARHLRRRGVPVAVLTGKITGQVLEDSAETQRIGAPRPLRELVALWRLLFLRKSNDGILCGIWYPEGLIAVLAGYRKIIILGYGNELMAYEGGWRKWFWHPLRKWVLRKASCVIADSTYAARLAVQASPAAESKRFRWRSTMNALLPAKRTRRAMSWDWGVRRF